MKLGVSYNLYDGEELLEASIRSIRSHVDYINVVYQDTSNAGERREIRLKDFLMPLVDNGLIDSLVLFEPYFGYKNNKIGTKNERKKRFIGMKDCARHGCSHFLLMDIDEFFRGEELDFAKSFIERWKPTVTAVPIVEYVKSPRCRLVSNYMFAPAGCDADDYQFFMPFICKVPRFAFRPQRGLAPCLADPTRFPVKRGRFHLFPKHEIAMHHMSTVRRNLERKFANSSMTANAVKELDENARLFMKMKEKILSFDPTASNVAPPDFGFIGNFPYRIVDDDFGVEKYLEIKSAVKAKEG